MSVMLRSYPAYKLTGVPWLGDIPEHWGIPRTKVIFEERVEKGLPDEPPLAATQTIGVVRKDRYDNRTVLALKDLHLLKRVLVGDFVISLRSFQGGIEYAHDHGIISPAYTILHPDPRSSESEYLKYLFKSAPYIENLKLHVTGIRQGQNIDYAQLSRSKIPLPPLPEQRAIARYLDYMDGRIQRYIKAKERLIELLEEQKRAVINQAVTRGLDPDVPLKPSGVEWLGDVPAHWGVARFSSIVRLKRKRGNPSEELLSVYLDLGVIRFSEIDERRTNPTSDDLTRYQLVEIGDLVLNNQQAWRGSVGVSKHKGIVSPAYLVLSLTKRFEPEFANLLFRDRSMIGQYLIASRGVGTIQRQLYWSHLKNASAPVPPKIEQIRIAETLKRHIHSTDIYTCAARRQIRLVSEYRTRLIADVVTGKLDVRDAAANLPDEVDEDALPEQSSSSDRLEMAEVR